MSTPRGLKGRKPVPKLWLILGSFLLLVTILFIVLCSYRETLAQNFINAGEEDLSECQYLPALVNFRKSEFLARGSAAEAISRAESMQQDLLAGEVYFRKFHKDEMMESINKAKQIPRTESSGLERVKSEIETGSPQLAEVTAGILIEMDERSAKAWAYLGVSRLQTARTVALSDAGRRTKLESAKLAFEKAIELDAEDTLSPQYLSEVNELLK